MPTLFPIASKVYREVSICLTVASVRSAYLFLISLLSQPGAATLALNPVVAGRSHLAVHDSPDLLSQVLGELGRVGNDDDTTLESFLRALDRAPRESRSR